MATESETAPATNDVAASDAPAPAAVDKPKRGGGRTKAVSNPKAAASPKKSAAAAAPKAKKPKTPANHPTYGEMIKKAINDLKERKGSSKAAILKYILSHYQVGDNQKQINAHLKQALKHGVSSKALKQTSGTGASGSFRINDLKSEGGAPAAKPKKSPGIKKANAAKSPKAPKAKSAVKKSPTKKAAAKKTAAAAPAAVPESTAAATPTKPKASPKKAVKKNTSPKKKASPKKGGKAKKAKA